MSSGHCRLLAVLNTKRYNIFSEHNTRCIVRRCYRMYTIAPGLYVQRVKCENCLRFCFE